MLSSLATAGDNTLRANYKCDGACQGGLNGQDNL